MTKKLQGQKRTDGGKTNRQQRSEEDRAGEGEEWCNTEGGVRQRHRQAYKKKRKESRILKRMGLTGSSRYQTLCLFTV